MDLNVITKKVFELILPFLKSKSIQKVKKDFSEATNNSALEIWEKIKPIFIKEDVTNDLKVNPDDPDLHAEVRSIIKRSIQKDNVMKNELESIIKSIEDSTKGIYIKDSKNILLGNVTDLKGNITIGDSNPNKNENKEK